jgi:endonuclease YncB( thermonuclease family)
MSTMGNARTPHPAGRGAGKLRRLAWTVPLAAGTWLALCWPLAAADISGSAVVIDGDTIDVAGERIRLHGIDAPERRQVCTVGGTDWSCGESARLALVHEARGRKVTCKGQERDRYGRLIAVCSAGGVDLNAMMVREGLALAYRRYSKDYVGVEESARRAHKGLWRSSFVEPWKWRRSGTAQARSERR